MITATYEIKDKINMKQLNLLQGNIVDISATDILSKPNEEQLDFTNLSENKTKGLISKLKIKNCTIFYHTVLQQTVLYCTIPNYTVMYCTLLYYCIYDQILISLALSI